MYQYFLHIFVNVHKELLYRHMEAVYALKQQSFVYISARNEGEN